VGLARYTGRTFVRELAVLGIAAIWWIPLYLLVVTSLKSGNGIVTSPFSLPNPATTSNYSAAWKGTTIGLGHGLINSLIITVGSVLCILALGSVAAYTIARRPGRLTNTLYFFFLLGIIVPFQLGVVPAFVALHQLGLTGSYVGMILLYTGMLMPLAVFLYTGFVRALPKDYEEAAAVDGASRLRIFGRVVFPLMLPVTGTVAVLTGIFIWNDFFTQLVMLNGTNNATVPTVIYSFVGQYSTQFNTIFAAVAISIIPVLAFFLFAQRTLIRGFSGGIRG
jgi:raffinose/stachyose/melibiose transport system permease protein